MTDLRNTIIHVPRRYIMSGLASAAILMLFWPAADAADPLPPTGYIGIDTTKAAAAAVSQAQKARWQAIGRQLDLMTPAAGRDPALAKRPHILHKTTRSVRREIGDRTLPVGNHQSLVLKMESTTETVDDRMQEFDDLASCMASAAWWLRVQDATSVEVACLPKGGAKPLQVAAPPESK